MYNGLLGMPILKLAQCAPVLSEPLLQVICNSIWILIIIIVDTSISNYEIDWWHCTIYIIITVTGISRRLTKKL